MSDYRPIKNQILMDHGANLRVHYDIIGMLRVGVNHLVIPEDRLHNGDTIGAALCNQYFEQDFETCIAWCIEYAPSFLLFSPELQKAVVSLVYLTGGPRIWLSELLAHIEKEKNYDRAIEILERSPWFYRSPVIVGRLITILKTLKKGGSDV
ncbi:MAG: hypothetical protein PHN88_14900 [Ignavibacteria bacterium]|nr:hypothetical protein [Ignavibacteria bacterium]